MLIKVAVADKNTDYSERLAEALEEYTELRVSLYTDSDALIRAASERRFDVLLLDASMLEEGYRHVDESLIIMLAGDGDIPYSYIDAPRIKKYQRISAIYHELLAICADKLGVSSGVPSGRAAIYTFYSPVGGCGKTTASLIAATKLASHGKRVLYVSFECLASDDCYLPMAAASGLSALLERVGQKEEQAMLFMKGIVQTKSDNLFYIGNFASPNDYAAMETNDLAWLIELFRRSGAFDCVILDTESCFDDKIKRILDLSDRIVLLERADAISKAKITKFLSQAFVADEYAHKMCRVLNFYNGRDIGVESEIPYVGRIGFVAGADSGTIIQGKANSADAAFALMLEN